MFIINADDFGLGDAENHGIALSFERGYCSSATIIPIAPAFLHACQIARENKFIKYLGLHASLCDGFALSDLMRCQKRFCDAEGRLIFSGKNVLMPLTYQEQCALADELRCQIAYCRREGLSLTHIDSHYHVHQIWSIASVVIAIARQEKIPLVRIKQNVVIGAWRLKQRLYTGLFNARLRVLGLAHTRYLVSIEALLQLNNLRRISRICTSCEIIIHPIVNEKGVLMNKCFDTLYDLGQQMQTLDKVVGVFSYKGKKG